MIYLLEKLSKLKVLRFACRKFNIFIYGCENRRHSDKFLKEQVYPLMLHKNTAEKFSFEDCKYNKIYHEDKM